MRQEIETFKMLRSEYYYFKYENGICKVYFYNAMAFLKKNTDTFTAEICLEFALK